MSGRSKGEKGLGRTKEWTPESYDEYIDDLMTEGLSRRKAEKDWEDWFGQDLTTAEKRAIKASKRSKHSVKKEVKKRSKRSVKTGVKHDALFSQICNPVTGRRVKCSGKRKPYLENLVKLLNLAAPGRATRRRLCEILSEQTGPCVRRKASQRRGSKTRPGSTQKSKSIQSELQYVDQVMNKLQSKLERQLPHISDTFAKDSSRVVKKLQSRLLDLERLHPAISKGDQNQLRALSRELKEFAKALD
jgi:hypothetical protein